MNIIPRVTFLLSLLLSFLATVDSECTFTDTKTPAVDNTAYQKLRPLVGHRYTVNSADYVYTVGICTDATESKDSVAVIQTTKDTKNPTTKIIGKYSYSNIKAGTNWIYLQYAAGDKYNSHCNNEPRKAVILFICDPKASDSSPGMKLLEEENGKDSDCYYLFELAHPEICASSQSSSSLSVGSIVLIVFFCVMSVYLLGGAIYQRFVLGAKGIEQVPNYEFWKDFGNLQADGCDFVCRTQDARKSSPYKGLGDDQLVEEAEERDDNLLPM